MPNIQSIIQRCLSGDRKAQRELFDHYGQTLYAVARRYCRHHQDAQDVLQEAWIKIFKKLDHINNYDTVEGWLKKVVINTSLRALQHSWNKVDLQHEHSDDESIPANVLSDLGHDDLMTKIGQLPTGYREVLLLHLVDGYSHKEIGQMLGIAAGTSRAKLSVARGWLRKLLSHSTIAIL